MPSGQPAEIDFRTDAADLRNLLGKSSQVPERLRSALRKRIRQAAQVAADDSKRTVLGAPGTRSRHPRHTGLRQGIADGIKVSVMTGARAGVTIRSTGAGLPADKRSLVLAYESRKGWRHPVFGDTERWVTQLGRPYFGAVIFKHRPEVTAAVEAALREAVEAL